MSIKRIPIYSAADPNHGTVMLEGKDHDRLPDDRLFINDQGNVIDGREGHTLRHLKGDEMEIPRLTYGG